MNESFDPVGILRVLTDRDVEYVVVGGLAVAVHGVLRATRDLDLVVAFSWENAEKLAGALAAIGGRGVDGSRDAATKEALVRRENAELDTDLGPVHILGRQAGVPSYSDLVADAELREVDGVQFRVCSVDQLRAMKSAAGRGKDLIDLNELDRLRELDS